MMSGYLEGSRSCCQHDHLLARHEKVAVDVMFLKYCHEKDRKMEDYTPR